MGRQNIYACRRVKFMYKHHVKFIYRRVCKLFTFMVYLCVSLDKSKINP